MAEQLRLELQQHPERPTLTRRPAPRQPVRHLRSVTAVADANEPGTADPDDVELIEENQARIMPSRLRNRPPQSTRFVRSSSSTASTPSATSSSDFQDADTEFNVDIEHHEKRQRRRQVLCGNAPKPTVASPSSIERVSCSFEVDLAAKADETIKARMARSSQEHAEERVRERRKYWEVPPASNLNDTSIAGRSIIDKIVKLDGVRLVCRLCKREWSSSAEAQRHEALSALHSSNLQKPPLVTAALTKPLSASRNREHMPACTSEIDGAQSSRPVQIFRTPAHAERELSVEIVDPPPRVEKGKKRAAPSPTPTPVRRSFYADKLLDVSAWGRRSLGGSNEAAFEILDNVALSFDEEAAARAAQRAADRVAGEPSSPDSSRSAHAGMHSTNWT